MSGAWRRKILEWKERKEEIRCCLNYFICKKRGTTSLQCNPHYFCYGIANTITAESLSADPHKSCLDC